MSLADLKARKQAIKDREAAKDRQKASWLTEILGADPKKPEKSDTVEVVFRQELDDAAPGYDPDRGKAQVVVEHFAPGDKGFLKRASCSLESEGECYACERHAQNWEEGWRQRTNFYVNVAARPLGSTEPFKPYVLSRNFNASFVDVIMAEAEDEEYDNSITNNVFHVTKTGAKNTTAWTPKRRKTEAPDVSDLEFFDIDETVLRKIPYADQPKWYLGDSAVKSASDEDAPTGAPAAADDEW